MKQITVLHVVGPTCGGIKEYVRTLVANTDRSRFKLIVASSEHFTTNMPHVEHIHINVTLRAIPMAIWTLCKVLLSTDVDIIHAHGLKANLAAIMASGICNRGKVIYTVHGGISFSNKQRTKGKLYTMVECFLIRHNTKVVTVSHLLRKELQKRTGNKQPNIVTIHTGIDECKLEFKSDLAALRKRLNIPSNSRIIGSIARLAPQKGLSYLIKAMKQVVNREPNTVLILAGDGPLTDELKHLAEKEGVLSHIRFLGFVNDIGGLLELMEVFVLPSWTEGLPITILEALLAGRAVVATKVGGIPEIIVHGQNGLLVNPRDPDALAKQILKLLENDKLRQELGIAGQHTVKDRFSLERMVTQYSMLYSEVVTSKQWIGDVEEQNV